jgi:hypothetical protein
MQAGKLAIETLGLSRATEIKSWQHFGNVISAMVTLWAKEEELRITKTAMREELDLIVAADSVEAMATKVKEFVAKKK